MTISPTTSNPLSTQSASTSPTNSSPTLPPLPKRPNLTLLRTTKTTCYSPRVDSKAANRVFDHGGGDDGHDGNGDDGEDSDGEGVDLVLGHQHRPVLKSHFSTTSSVPRCDSSFSSTPSTFHYKIPHKKYSPLLQFSTPPLPPFSLTKHNHTSVKQEGSGNDRVRGRGIAGGGLCLSPLSTSTSALTLPSSSSSSPPPPLSSSVSNLVSSHSVPFLSSGSNNDSSQTCPAFSTSPAFSKFPFPLIPITKMNKITTTTTVTSSSSAKIRSSPPSREVGMKTQETQTLDRSQIQQQREKSIAKIKRLEGEEQASASVYKNLRIETITDSSEDRQTMKEFQVNLPETPTAMTMIGKATNSVKRVRPKRTKRPQCLPPPPPPPLFPPPSIPESSWSNPSFPLSDTSSEMVPTTSPTKVLLPSRETPTEQELGQTKLPLPLPPLPIPIPKQKYDRLLSPTSISKKPFKAILLNPLILKTKVTDQILVELNVGGIKFTTTAQTLIQGSSPSSSFLSPSSTSSSLSPHNNNGGGGGKLGEFVSNTIREARSKAVMERFLTRSSIPKEKTSHASHGVGDSQGSLFKQYKTQTQPFPVDSITTTQIHFCFKGDWTNLSSTPLSELEDLSLDCSSANEGTGIVVHSPLPHLRIRSIRPSILGVVDEGKKGVEEKGRSPYPVRSSSFVSPISSTLPVILASPISFIKGETRSKSIDYRKKTEDGKPTETWESFRSESLKHQCNFFRTSSLSSNTIKVGPFFEVLKDQKTTPCTGEKHQMLCHTHDHAVEKGDKDTSEKRRFHGGDWSKEGEGRRDEKTLPSSSSSSTTSLSELGHRSRHEQLLTPSISSEDSQSEPMTEFQFSNPSSWTSWTPEDYATSTATMSMSDCNMRQPISCLELKEPQLAKISQASLRLSTMFQNENVPSHSPPAPQALSCLPANTVSSLNSRNDALQDSSHDGNDDSVKSTAPLNTKQRHHANSEKTIEQGTDRINIFLDRSGTLYHHILAFLRDGTHPSQDFLHTASSIHMMSSAPPPPSFFSPSAGRSLPTLPDQDESLNNLASLYPDVLLKLISDYRALQKEATWLQLADLVDLCQIELRRSQELLCKIIDRQGKQNLWKEPTITGAVAASGQTTPFSSKLASMKERQEAGWI